MRALSSGVLILALISIVPRSAAAELLTRTGANDPSCPGYRWIGVKKNRFAACPSAGAWRGEPLFGPIYSGASCASRGSAWRAGLDRFCVYKAPAEPGKPLPEPPRELRKKLGKLGKDCVGIEAYQAKPGGVKGVSLEALERHFVAEAGGVGTADWDEALREAPGRVRLSLLDTQPTHEGVPTERAASLHGFSLAHFAHRLACGEEGEGDCGFQLATRLAMPVLEYAPPAEPGGLPEPKLGEEKDGGRFGRFEDLALAVAQEVVAADTTREESGSRAPRRQVLSLALGWDGELFGGLEADPEDMPAAVLAVYEALVFARERGLLVLAAAGNRGPVGRSTCGQLLPAAWERRLASGGLTGVGKLVYGVGGVQSEGLPLANARLCSLPAQVAFGDHAVVWARDGEPTATLTGSSVAVTVAATSAAAAWGQRPELGPDELMTLIRHAGDPLPNLPGLFRVPENEALSHRISFCSAVRAAVCAGDPASPRCAEGLKCDSWDAGPPKLDWATATPPSGGVNGPGSISTLTGFSCSQRGCPLPEGSPIAKLPAEPFAPVRPQPEIDPCINCGAGGGWLTGGPTRNASLGGSRSIGDWPCQVLIAIDPHWFGANGFTSLTADRLELDRVTASGIERTSYPIVASATFAPTTTSSPSSEAVISLPEELCRNFGGAVARLWFIAHGSDSSPGDPGREVEGQVFVNFQAQ